MVWNVLSNWSGAVEIDGTRYASVSEIPRDLALYDGMNILLKSSTEAKRTSRDSVDEQIYHIKVKPYMTKKATPDFDFMKKWNNDVPMPLVEMVGTKVKETRGMVYMKLHADTRFQTVQFCMKCGRPITNPVSQFFGMGPECGDHNYVNPFNSDKELKEAVDKYKREVLSKIEWSGWVIKSAIVEEELLKVPSKSA